MDLDLCRLFHKTASKYTLFSSAHGTLSRIGHVIGYKTSLSKFKKKELIPTVLSDHNDIKLEINRRKCGKSTHM